MARIFSDYAYGPGPRQGCWWDETIAAPDWPVLQGTVHTDIAIIGAGFTGMSAALHLADAGCKPTVLEAETPGWGASGRNGGFCCLGGARLSDSAIARRYGEDQANTYEQTEIAGVNLVGDLLSRYGINADTHSQGETQLAHRPRDMEGFRRKAEQIATRRGVEPELIEASDLADRGLNGPFYGAMTIPVGFGLNPRKYLFGLARAAKSLGADLYQKSAALGIRQANDGYIIETQQGAVHAKRVLIATNGYSSDDLPDWFSGRYVPSQSNVLVTRPLTQEEIAKQGWSSDQMAYDTRNLLHYFRLMPDNRFLFGMRGGLTSSPASEKRARARTRRQFESMFPAWCDVPSPFQWSGMVCLSAARVPFVGPIPGQPGLFAGLAFHGNGVAMGSYTGKLLADLVLGRVPDDPCPEFFARPMRKFPFGRARRAAMPLAYLYFAALDL